MTTTAAPSAAQSTDLETMLGDERIAFVQAIWHREIVDQARDAFLKRVRQTWKGSLGALQLPYYEATPSGGITWTRAGLDLVADWTPALFGTNQKRTKETLLR